MSMLWFRSLPIVENRGLHLFVFIEYQNSEKREKARKTKKTRGNLGFFGVHLFWHLFLVAGVGLEPHDLRVMSPTSYHLLHPAI